MSKYTEDEIEQLESLLNELININNELNAKCIWFDSMVKNAEAKQKLLWRQLKECEGKDDIINLN
jgi:Ser-tRNA(Ala) deacylase AlaX